MVGRGISKGLHMAKKKGRTPKPIEEMPIYRRCKICFPRSQGVGTAYATRGATRYYKCNHCGHTWTAIITTERTVIEHREVHIETRSE